MSQYRYYGQSLLLLLALCLTLPPGLLQAEDNTEAQPVEAAEQRSFKAIAEEYRGSIVTITHLDRNGEQLGMGTGFVIDEQGLIATNRHVLGEARPIEIEFADGSSYDIESIYASDELADLAILKVAPESLKGQKLKPLRLGKTVEQGDDVAAIGHPRGYRNSLVTGIVSGTEEINGRELIQVSMPIDHGNSGGPLLNQQGEVIGVITYKSASSNSIGFAMPISELQSILEKPNPVTLARWTTIGRLNPKHWQEHMGASWTQRAGRILVSGTGSGFGGRSVCLSQTEPPSVTKYEVRVLVKLGDESGAAGLIFDAEDRDHQFGFYPSGGNLRLTRFAGPSVYNWQILEEISTPAYRPGEWNELLVSIDDYHVRCFCNEQLVAEMRNRTPAENIHVGLAKFRDTSAEFRGFEVGESLQESGLEPEVRAELLSLVEKTTTGELTAPKTLRRIREMPVGVQSELDQLAEELEQRARELRKLRRRNHEMQVSEQILSELEEADADVVTLGLLLARYDNAEIDVDSYLQSVESMVNDVRELAEDSDGDEVAKRQLLDRYLFEESGFHGSRTNYYHKSNSYLSEVIDDREGLPITLSSLYIGMAERLGLDVRGIGLPGHFVVRQFVDGEPGDLLDVFDRGQKLGLIDAISRVEGEHQLPWNEKYLEPQSERQILVRMIRNLQGISEQEQDYSGVLRYLNLLVAVDTDNELEHRYLRCLIAIRERESATAGDDLAWLKTNGSETIPAARLEELEAFSARWLGGNEESPAGEPAGDSNSK
ncbi:transglutaminase family protein [Rubinisphaera margarita]|uniref:transglutaminase family protein n=1 Tax=Rubinisphaera margarita TaxID=2909586 RepID=UPI001EE9676C|nr:transglutaminase family protein [Rubinisphaera margarita]MCG6156100.1 trypsin-like peptidase domain-containing protein [Rubinisphaera margarita]